MQQLTVYIKSPDAIIWEGKAEWVSSVNSKGSFDILPSHANFLTIIENQPIRIKTDSKINQYLFSRSIIYTSNNEVHIYSNI